MKQHSSQGTDVHFFFFPGLISSFLAECIDQILNRDSRVVVVLYFFNRDPGPEVKKEDMSSYIFGWIDFFVVVLLMFALGFSTNAKMYALPLGASASRIVEFLGETVRRLYEPAL